MSEPAYFRKVQAQRTVQSTPCTCRNTPAHGGQTTPITRVPEDRDHKDPIITTAPRDLCVLVDAALWRLKDPEQTLQVAGKPQPLVTKKSGDAVHVSDTDRTYAVVFEKLKESGLFSLRLLRSGQGAPAILFENVPSAQLITPDRFKLVPDEATKRDEPAKVDDKKKDTLVRYPNQLRHLEVVQIDPPPETDDDDLRSSYKPHVPLTKMSQNP
jgi:hypothetical protein